MAQVLLTGEPRMNDVDRPAEPATVQIVLDLFDDRLIVGVARPHPAAHGMPSRVTARPSRPAANRDSNPWSDPGAASPIVPASLAAVSSSSSSGACLRRIHLPIGGGGVKKDHINLEVQEGSDAEEHRFLHPL